MIKKALFILTVLFVIVGCSKDESKNLASLIVGEWSLTGYEPTTKSIKIGDETITVTIIFAEDNTFLMTQQIGNAYLEDFSGTYLLTDNILTGKYSDGASWGESYTIDIVENKTLTMTTSTAGEIYSYTRVK